ncbi:secreted RxLR effector protein 161-like [Cannabis sativa]|uniref:secreted RxLR effector protein 161-like n=1 Tax=Cannabis sativa TaxID=3483 RepID=UPI0029CA0404|nr:secreted RxLR effector protein 161-like [Cannabis sativa]
MKVVPYASLVGSLMYAQVCTRPDITFVVGVLGRYLSDPILSHWKGSKKVMRYLQGCVVDKKSTSCYIFMMARGVVSWKSVKQTLTTSSTMEAEYMTCCEATCQVIWLRDFISALGLMNSISSPLKLYCNNSVAVAFSKNVRSTSRSKHIDIKYYFVKEKVTKSLISIEYTPSTGMLADPLTKGLPICIFLEHVARMGLLGA